MQITFVGTGNAFSRRYGNANALVEAEGVNLMIDFGCPAPERLERFGHSLGEVTHVAVSHLHADHVGGLEELAFASRFEFQRKPTLLLPGKIGASLWEHSLRGGLEWVSDDKGQAVQCRLEDYFHCVDLEEPWEQVGPLEIHTFPTDHVPGKESWGFVVREEETGHQAIFGCDSRILHPQLLEEPLAEAFASGPIFHDCNLDEPRPSGIHIHLGGIRYSPSVQERLIAVHYHDDVERHLAGIRRAGLKITFPGDVIRFPDWRSCVK